MHRSLIGISDRLPIRRSQRRRAGRSGCSCPTSRSAEPRGGRHHTLYADGPVDPLRGEYLVWDSAVSWLLSLRTGDRVRRDAAAASPALEVVGIVSAEFHVIQDAMLHYQDRFPMASRSCIDSTLGILIPVESLAPILASLHARRDFGERLLALYQQHTLPLGAVSTRLGVPLSAIMSSLTVRAAANTKLAAEWGDVAGQESSRTAARGASSAVLTRSALFTLQLLGLLEVVRDSCEWLAPQALVRELETELRTLIEIEASGRTHIASGPAGLSVDEVTPGDARVLTEIARMRELLTWVRTAIRN